jgi:hypothetical protein
MTKSWSFPTSPRNPGKVRIELKILSQFVDVWKKQGKKWMPNTTQIEFGEALRASGEIEEDSYAILKILCKRLTIKKLMASLSHLDAIKISCTNFIIAGNMGDIVAKSSK